VICRTEEIPRLAKIYVTDACDGDTLHGKSRGRIEY
jgi:hypothetical protein